MRCENIKLVVNQFQLLTKFFVGKKMKIGVFKLNWIAQIDLKFEVHKKHSGKKKRANIYRQTREGGRQLIHGYPLET